MESKIKSSQLRTAEVAWNKQKIEYLRASDLSRVATTNTVEYQKLTPTDMGSACFT